MDKTSFAIYIFLCLVIGFLMAPYSWVAPLKGASVAIFGFWAFMWLTMTFKN